VGQDEILRAVVNRAIQAAAGLDNRVTNPLQVVNLPHAGGRETVSILYEAQARAQCSFTPAN
jgi:hypothetical protein